MRPHQHNGKAAPFRPRPTPPLTEVGSIKWYDPERKFGFVRDDTGREHFLHHSVVRRFSIRPDDLQPGAGVRFNSRPSDAGRPEVTALAIAS